MGNENTTLQVEQFQPTSTELTFGNKTDFEHAQRVAKMLATSSLIPKEYQNNIPNTMIALEMANRIGANPMMVMQNLYVVHGKPSWSGSFVIAALNSCGRFTPIRFEITGQGDTLACRAYANDKITGERLNGSLVTMAMAKAEGWVDKAGSKWKTMPEQMIQYRSGAFFGRVYAPDVLMGMPTEDEVTDFTVMSSHEQESQINRLLDNSTLDERQRSIITFKLNNGISQSEAYEIMADLKNSQLPAGDRAQMNATDAKNAVAALL